MKPAPKISVVIATYNRRALLARTLPTVIAQDLDPEMFEVIVVSDGCTDDTVEFLNGYRARCDFHIIDQRPNQGQAKAANLGARAARGKYVLFLDDDIVCSSGLLRAHLESHEQQSKACLAFGPILVSDESLPTLASDWTRAYTQHYTGRLAQSCAPIWPDDANVDANTSLPRSTFLENGGFDESFLSARQNEDLGTRLWHGGLKFVYAPNAVVHQIFVKSNRAVAQKDGEAYGKAEIRIMRKLPYARAESSLATLIHARPLKRVLHRLVVSSPFSVEPLLRPICVILQTLRDIPLARHLGARILNSRRSIVFHRAAIREAGGMRAVKAEFGSVLTVIMYHHIGPQVPGTFPELTVSAEEFEAQLRLLKRRGYNTITAADWLAYVREGKPLPPKPMMLTFDDAYADLTQFGLPLLNKYDYSGIVFVPTAYVGNTNLWDQANGSAPHSMMTAEQIADWAAQGIEFGAHTRSHPCLKKLTSEAIDRELEGGKRDLEAIVGRPVTTFAYPYGEYGEREVECALRYYSLCFTTDEGTNNLTTNLGRLRRIMAYPDGSFMFRVSLALGFQPVRWLREHVRLRTRLRHLLNDFLGRPQAGRRVLREKVGLTGNSVIADHLESEFPTPSRKP